jgi:hypothetical protein
MERVDADAEILKDWTSWPSCMTGGLLERGLEALDQQPRPLKKICGRKCRPGVEPFSGSRDVVSRKMCV